jgi:hypothetical protein
MLKWSVAFSVAVIISMVSLGVARADVVSDICDIESFSYLSFGKANINVKTLNDHMVSLNLPEFSSRPYVFELGSNLFAQQLMLEWGIGGMFFSPQSKNNTKRSLMGGYGYMGTGVDLIGPGYPWKIYPFINFGGQILRFSYRAESLNFGDKVATTNTYYMTKFIGSYGCAIIRTFKTSNQREFLSIGVKAGAYVDPTVKSTWYRSGTKYKNGPAPLLAGPYLQIIIGKGHLIAG